MAGTQSVTGERMISRNYALDALKALCAFLVVCLHFAKYSYCEPLSPQYNFFFYLRALTSVAVPVFLLTTGYYLPVLISKNRHKKFLVKIVKITLVGSCCYMTLHLIRYYQLYGSQFIDHVFTIDNLRNFLLFNQPFSGGYHLWYLYAVIYSLIVFFVLHKLKILTKAVYLIIFLFLVFAIFSYFVGTTSVPPFLAFSMPMMAIGFIINRFEYRITHYRRRFDWILIAAIAIALVILGIEAFSRSQYIIGGYFSTFAVAVCIFILAVRHPMSLKDSIMSKIGRRHSTFIYVFHVALANFVWLCVPFIFFNPFLAPLTIFIVSLVCSVATRALKLKI